tara:strand:+ start:2737 stop:2865 length:129 start_codon:yes stop_codon:yes gene_type:complete
MKAFFFALQSGYLEGADVMRGVDALKRLLNGAKKMLQKKLAM